jgi:hypothetical protein
VFDAKAGVLRNHILPLGLKAIIARVYKGPSWLDDKECIVLDYSETSLVASHMRDEIRLIEPGLYLLGQSAADVEKVADDLGEPFLLSILGSVLSRSSFSFLIGLARRTPASNYLRLDATDAQATHSTGMFSHWLACPQIFHNHREVELVASAGETSQSHAFENDDAFSGAQKRTSTFLRSLRDLSNAGVP